MISPFKVASAMAIANYRLTLYAVIGTYVRYWTQNCTMLLDNNVFQYVDDQLQYLILI